MKLKDIKKLMDNLEEETKDYCMLGPARETICHTCDKPINENDSCYFITTGAAKIVDDIDEKILVLDYNDDARYSVHHASCINKFIN
jgi:hypothetical protein